MINKITSFQGEYAFLSNFYYAPVIFEATQYITSEAAYQAAKTLDKKERLKIRKAKTPGAAKKLGQKVTLRDDWEDIKWDVMFGIVWQKFTQNKDLTEKLLATGDAELVEGNWWGDVTWGVCNGKGKNHLGR